MFIYINNKIKIMESKSLLEAIKSKYIIRKIFSLQKDIKTYKIVAHSKTFQNILYLGLQNYKEKCFESFKCINLLKCLSANNYHKMSLSSENPEYLRDIYNKEIEKCKMKKGKFNQIIDEYCDIYFTNIYNDYKSKEDINKIILDNQLIIDIYSPLFEKLFKKEIFEKLFILSIPFEMLNKKELLNEYSKAIDLLNEFNPKFSSFYFDIDDYCDYFHEDLFFDFKKFLEHFKNIKKLIIKNRSCSSFLYEIMSNPIIKNNIIYLELIDINPKYSYILDKINEFKSLEDLRLENISSFHLTKTNLKYLYLTNSQITIDSKSLENLIIFNIFNNYTKFPIFINKEKIKMEKIVKFKASYCDEKFDDIFDLKSFHKLKYFIRLNIYSFLNLGETLLEKVYIRDTYVSKSLDNEMEMLKKLIGIKTLKEVKIDISYLKEKNINEIEGENPSVEKLIINLNDNSFYINYDDDNKKIILYSIQKKFPNLKEFQIYINEKNPLNTKISKLEINPDSNCKINKFKFSGGNNGGTTTIFNTTLFENLEDVEFACMGPSFNYEESFPLFNKNCNIIFKSLTRFRVVIQPTVEQNKYFNIQILRNVINNLNKAPNLKTFIFNAPCKRDEMLCRKLIRILLSRNITNIDFNLKVIYHEYDNEYFSEQILGNICKRINITNFENIKINY